VTGKANMEYASMTNGGYVLNGKKAMRMTLKSQIIIRRIV